MKSLLLLVSLMSFSAYSADNCNILSYEQHLPKELLEVLDKQGYSLHYYVLDEFSRESLRSAFKLRYSSVNGARFLGGKKYSLVVKGRGLKVKIKSTDLDDLVETLKAELTACL